MTTQGQRFRRRALRRGYKVDEVDAFLDRAEATLAGDLLDEPVTATEVHDVVFRVRFGGYDEWQVDVYLDRLERQLAKLEQEGGHAAPAARPAERPSRLSREEPYPQQERGYGAEPGYGEPGYGPEPYERGARDFGAERAARGRGDFGPGRDEFGPGRGDFGPSRDDTGYGQPLDEPTTISRRGGDRGDRGAPAAGPPAAGMAPPHDPRMPAGPPMPGPLASYPDPGQRHGMAEGPHGGPPAASPPARPPAAAPPGHGGQPDMTQQIPNMRAGSGGYEVPGRHGKLDMTTEIGTGDSPFTPDDLARLDQLRRTFQLRRFGSGYDRGQVDRLFDAIGATMAGRSAVTVTDGELDPGQFSLVQGGYFEAEIDTALREVRDLFSKRGVTR
ncbi:MAG: DivIVA domain-containing protein [Micromonosporaceae bacterium]|nr:DivIVA domain-containing protein [Micromonosporaceae bacterium]